MPIGKVDPGQPEVELGAEEGLGRVRPGVVLREQLIDPLLHPCFVVHQFVAPDAGGVDAGFGEPDDRPDRAVAFDVEERD